MSYLNSIASAWGKIWSKNILILAYFKQNIRNALTRVHNFLFKMDG